MNRGAVVIGIDKYTEGNLRSLQAAVKGAKAFADWASNAGFEVTLLTDEAGPVGIADVRRAIANFTKRSGDDALQQLVVYFAGHGINKGYSEYWLLSEAPLVTSEAVNLRSTIDRARYDTGIPHVIFISDACRTAADSINAQEVVGDVPFLNEGRDGLEISEVDRFFGATVGRPAQEVRVVEDAVAAYTALYTECLLDALSGKFPDVFEEGFENGAGYITSRKLKQFLPAEVARRVVALKLKRAQDPDTQVESDYPPKFIVQAALQKAPPDRPVMRGLPNRALPPVREQEQLTLSTLAGDRVIAAMAGRDLPATEPAGPITRSGRTLAQNEVLALLEADERVIMQSRSRGHFESECGFSITGARFAAADAVNSECEVIDNGESVRVNFIGAASPRSILLQLEDGRAAVLAALPSYIGTLTVDEGELVNVTYEPAENSDRWQQWGLDVDRLRTLRAVIGAATRNGVFRVDKATAEQLGDAIRVLKGIDPTLGLYAAYAYADIGMLDKVRSVAGYMLGDLSADLFDVAMLARDGRQPAAAMDPLQTAPFCPMLSQGWALLQAKQVRLPEPVAQASRRLLPSLWTLFPPDAAALLRDALRSGAIR